MPLTSILVVLDRTDRDESLIARALALGRKSNARIELFSCDAMHEYELRRAYVARGVEATRAALISAMREYLQPIADRIAAENLAVSIEAVCDTPLYEGIVHKILGSCPDLVMKAAASDFSGGHAKLGLNDWQLVRASPVPLLLSRGRTWPAQPHFAAVVDVTEEETPGLAATILRAADCLRTACGGGALDVLFGEILDADAQGRKVHAATLAKLAKEAHVDVPQIRLLAGDPAMTLSASAGAEHYDVLVLGALAHRRHLTPLVGTLTRKLMETLACDFVLIKSAMP